MSERDELIGRNVVRLRGDRAQKDVADAMRQRGHKWSQATVWSVEKGERPLRLTEADDLVNVLGYPSVRLSAPDAETRGWAMLRELRAAESELERAVERYIEAQDQLAFAVSEGMISGRVAQLIAKELEVTPWRIAREKYEDLAARGKAEVDDLLAGATAEVRAKAEKQLTEPAEPFKILRDSREA
ncbi:hypothetical protein [Curtobacterium sp. MCBD17_021]|uniref:hypothetical protein n=1 Tax=Curtobacterium sp. MCBD17_021 TaxID=2175665 RepID=UPI0011B73369|nr:hypothetical protein [Curtobacterium sp. MCBD17_021]